MANRKWIQPGKEYIELVVARKNYSCHECNKPIFKGDRYVLDCINYITKTKYDRVFLKWYRNRICLNSWIGDLP